MTILITGSSGKTAANLANMLAPEHSILVASRSPKSDSKHPTVRFDWLDESTWSRHFEQAVAQKDPIKAVYLVLPDIPAARQQAMRFVRLANSKGVNRFVLLSAWENPAWGPLLGPVHGELEQFAQQHGIGWTVLRPHFFMENFAEGYHLDSIRNEGKIYTAAKDGKKPFISAKDIAAVAYHGLVDNKPHNIDYVMTGADSVTYDQVANIFSEVLGKRVQHVSLSEGELRKKLLAEDFTEDMAEYMAKLDVRVAAGLGWEPTDAVKKVTGRDPRSFRNFVEENKEIWL